MFLTDQDIAAIWLTLKLASLVTLILLILGIPLAWWLTHSKTWWKKPINALVAMPLVLPPSVLGFYLLITLGPNGPIGYFTKISGLGNLPFSFGGLVIASIFYSLPFTVQPLQNAFVAIGNRPLEVAATLRASPVNTFFTVVIPLSLTGILNAAILTFAHTIGEFGIVLMIGGNIPGITQVASIQIYNHVEAMEYAQAHRLAAVMLVFAFIVLLALYVWQPDDRKQN